MGNLFARLFLTISAISFFVVVYMVKTKYNFLDAFVSDWVSYLIYVFCVLILTPLALLICEQLPNDDISSAKSIELANNEFLPNYLAFFFVALAIPYVHSTPPTNPLTEPAFLLVFITMLVLIFMSRASYFNPIFLMIGYNFYYIITPGRVKIMLISKGKYKSPEQIKELKVKRINDYAFIEVKSK